MNRSAYTYWIRCETTKVDGMDCGTAAEVKALAKKHNARAYRAARDNKTAVEYYDGNEWRQG